MMNYVFVTLASPAPAIPALLIRTSIPSGANCSIWAVADYVIV